MSFASAGPQVSGKFLEVDGRRFLVKGVTYGTFAPDAERRAVPGARADRPRTSAMMAEAGINTVRVYTVPEIALLDAAARHGLRVMIGVPWTQHVAFLDDRALTREHSGAGGRDRARAGVAPGGAAVRRRQRDSAGGRPLARHGSRRALPPRSVRRVQAGGARRAC